MGAVVDMYDWGCVSYFGIMIPRMIDFRQSVVFSEIFCILFLLFLFHLRETPLLRFTISVTINACCRNTGYY